MSVKPLRSANVGLNRRAVAAENRRLADEEEREAEQAEMAVCLSAVGDANAASDISESGSGHDHLTGLLSRSRWGAAEQR